MDLTPRLPHAPPADPPVGAGVWLPPAQFDDWLARLPAVGWLAVDSEEALAAGGRLRWVLGRLAARYPLALHEGWLCPGDADPPDAARLARLEAACAALAPAWVVLPLGWRMVDGRPLALPLPLPATGAVLEHLVARVRALREALGRPLVLENLPSLLPFRHATLPEWTLAARLAERADCRLLLHLGHLQVTARQHGFDPLDYLNGLPPWRVAGYRLGTPRPGRPDAPPDEGQWALLRAALLRIGPRPTLSGQGGSVAALEDAAHRIDRLLDGACRARTA